MKRRPSPPPSITEEDATLFREAIGPVRPVEVDPTPPDPRPKPRPRARLREADEADALHTSRYDPFDPVVGDPEETLAYRRPEVSERILRRLRRGLYRVDDEVDLHRLTLSDAEAVLRRFMAEARDSGHGCLRVIHGKGLHSKAGGPLIKPMVERMLSLRADVLAYASAPAGQGGTGALLVLVGKRRPSGPG